MSEKDTPLRNKPVTIPLVFLKSKVPIFVPCLLVIVIWQGGGVKQRLTN
jgi:hypothetical protein